ncbi:hypothetical protein ACNKHR_07180 [Shigella flexneri]
MKVTGLNGEGNTAKVRFYAIDHFGDTIEGDGAVIRRGYNSAGSIA